MINTLEHLAKGSLAYDFLDLKAIGYVVFDPSQVLTIFCVKPVIIGIFLLRFLERFLVTFFLSAILIHIIDCLVLPDFC